MNYRIVLTPDDNDTFLVTCPALPEVTTFGETEPDCLRHALDAIEEAIAARIANAQPIPEGAGEDGHLSVELPPLTALKIDLYRAFRSQGITRAELSRRLKWNRNSVDRLFRLDHASRLDQIEAAANALGKHVRVEIA